MILLDPDLDPDPSPQTISARGLTPAGISTRSLALFLRKAQAAVRLRGQVSVLLTTDAAIRKLNRKFRGKNKATDVLSFPAMDMHAVTRSRSFDRLRTGSGAPESRLAGDLAISVDMARKQAEAFGHSLGTELKVLLLHGLLHLAGYDHETDDGGMAKRESALRAKLGLPLGLIERTASESASQRVSKSALSHPSRKDKGAASIHPSEYKSLTGGPGMGHPPAGVSARRRKP